MNIGKNIKFHRKRLGFSLELLSKITGISPSGICMMEKDTRNPTLKTLVNLALAFGITLDELVYGDQKPEYYHRNKKKVDIATATRMWHRFLRLEERVTKLEEKSG